MKRVLLTLLVSASFTSWSQCETNIIASDTMVCPGDNVTLEAFGPSPVLTTTFAGGNNHRGNMFDIFALNSVTIESFDSHPVGDTDYEVYYKVGTHVGSETNAAAWTLLGAATNVIAQPSGNATTIPINVGITIPAGQTYSFYVTSTDVSVSQSYTDGTTAGAVFVSDANIEFLEGSAMEYPFGGGGAVFSPRVWNGNINYSIETTYLWDNGATTAQVVNTPIAETTYYVDITYTGCSTITDSVTIYMDPNCPVGLIEGMTKHMKVYPNPTENVLHIELDQMTSEPVLHVYSGVGTLVLTEKITSQSQTLDLSSLARGSYILELSADNYKEIIKVIKN